MLLFTIYFTACLLHSSPDDEYKLDCVRQQVAHVEFTSVQHCLLRWQGAPEVQFWQAMHPRRRIRRFHKCEQTGTGEKDI